MLQQAIIAVKIPVFLKVVLLIVSLFGIFIFGRYILNSQYTQYENCQTIIIEFDSFFISILLHQRP